MNETPIENDHLPGSWAWSKLHKQSVQVIDSGSIWGQTILTVYRPGGHSIERVDASGLSAVSARPWDTKELHARALVLAAAEALNKPKARTVTMPTVVPLPHQLSVVEKALETSEPRLLLADEVGLGKTIEAGLILKELKNRGLVRRTIVVAPKSMQIQWISEMKNRFDEEFVRFGPGGIPYDVGTNPWEAFDQIVCTIDSVKPISDRKGWSKDRVNDYNRTRFESLVSASWDLVIIDEAHHAAGSEDDVARHELARRLSKSSSRILLLSATPHSGKSDSFARLMSLLDADFSRGKPINPSTVKPLVIRTEKRNAKSVDGSPLFQPRTTSLERVPYGSRTVENQLYDSVTDYVRHRYQAAMLEKNYAAGFLTLLMQRLVSSSTAAILSALEKRKLALTEIGDQLELFPGGAEDWGDLSAEDQLDAFVSASEQAWGDELREVELLVDLAKKASVDIDSKADHLLQLIQRVRRESGNPSLKVLVFTEFRETQNMLITTLGSAGISVSRIDGSLSINAREAAQREFESTTDVLVSTDAGGEGINLHFANVVINYDMPWNPMRVEQRIGRVDRIGQKHPVRAFNLVNEHSIDDRVLQILESKLATILADIGIDKRCDVLETSSRDIENLYTSALLDPERVESIAQDMIDDATDSAKKGTSIDELLGSNDVASVSTTNAGLLVSSALAAWANWSGTRPENISAVTSELPVVAPGEPVPVLSGTEPGTTSVWDLYNDDIHRIFSVHLSDGGVFRPDLASRSLEESAGYLGDVRTTVLNDEQWGKVLELGPKFAPSDTKLEQSDSSLSLDLRLVLRVEP